MLLRSLSNTYNLVLSLGAFYLGVPMLLGSGDFASFPPEWLGVLPFTNWASLAIFGMLVFGIGNGIATIYGCIKSDYKIFAMTFTMGALFFFSTVIPTMMLGVWYLPTSAFVVFSVIQMILGLFGFLLKKRATKFERGYKT